jgi:hypothetical protein
MKLTEAQQTSTRMAKDVFDIVLGYIKACDPCSFNSLFAECLEQVVGFEKLNRFSGSIFIDQALNLLIRQGLVIVESCDGLHKEGNFTVCFRQA